jgi:hypothetical protein
MPCRAMPCRAMPRHATPCRAMPCRAVPCHAVPCHAVPCHAVPCRAMPCQLASTSQYSQPTDVGETNYGPFRDSIVSRDSAKHRFVATSRPECAAPHAVSARVRFGSATSMRSTSTLPRRQYGQPPFASCPVVFLAALPCPATRA